MATDQLPSIGEFYAHKSVFITGGTGFIGKVLIEKLLRCCPDIGSVYCLVREKRGCRGDERLKKLFEGRLFDTLREMQPDFASKVHAVHGDITENDLGISTEMQQFLAKTINVVFHSAATVKFDEHLRLAVIMNLLSVRQIVALCRKMTKLEVLLHVSTAYCNCDRYDIDEVIYPPAMEPQKLINALGWMTDDMVNLTTPYIIEGRPNTYTFTKQLAEYLLSTEGKDLPIAIVRPSIVTSAWKEPMPGWIDNFNGPNGAGIAMGKGLLRTFYGNKDSVADFIPVDVCVNMIVSAAWYTAINRPPEVTVYHATTGSVNPYTWGEIKDTFTAHLKAIPFEDCFRVPKTVFTTNILLHGYLTFVKHIIPAYLADIVCRIAGKKPRMVTLYQKLHKGMQSLNYFACRSWVWSHKNTDMLQNKMSIEDQKVFFIDPTSLNWSNYLEDAVIGYKTFMLKENMGNIASARAQLKRLRNMTYLLNTVGIVVLWRLLVTRSTLAHNSWYFVLSLVFKFLRFFRITSTI